MLYSIHATRLPNSDKDKISCVFPVCLFFQHKKMPSPRTRDTHYQVTLLCKLESCETTSPLILKCNTIQMQRQLGKQPHHLLGCPLIEKLLLQSKSYPLNINPLPFMSMREHVVTYSSEACGSMLQLIAWSMGEHVSIFICNLSWVYLKIIGSNRGYKCTLLPYV